ncbi:restriction endonuclease subunit S [Ferruginibacter sp.]
MSEWKETEFGLVPDNWETVTVGDLVEQNILEKPMDGNHGNIHPKGSDFITTGIPFVMASDINNGKLDITNCSFISEKLARTLQKGFSIQGDVLLTHKASLGRTAIVGKIDTPFIMLTPQVTYYRIKKENKLDRYFLKYFFDCPSFQAILENHGNSGSTRAYVGITAQRELPILLPPIIDQKTIASILSSLDDKIDLLHHQNATLEKMAETLFRQSFVEEAKEEWEDGNIYNFIDVVYGFPFKSKYFNEEQKGLPLIRIRDLKDGYSNIYTDEECDDKFIIHNGDLVAGMDGEFRLYIWSGVKSVLNQRACKFVPKYDYVPKFYVFSIMKPHLHYYENTKVGTTVIHLGKSDIDDIKISIPPKELLVKYGNITDKWFDKIKNNNNQIRTLTTLRDTLLPKLMSGEVRVAAD